MNWSFPAPSQRPQRRSMPVDGVQSHQGGRVAHVAHVLVQRWRGRGDAHGRLHVQPSARPLGRGGIQPPVQRRGGSQPPGRQPTPPATWGATAAPAGGGGSGGLRRAWGGSGGLRRGGRVLRCNLGAPRFASARLQSAGLVSAHGGWLPLRTPNLSPSPNPNTLTLAPALTP